MSVESGPTVISRRWPGEGDVNFFGDGGPATHAQLDSPQGVLALPDGGLLVSDTANNKVRRVRPDGSIATAAGTGRPAFGGDAGPATAAALHLPIGLAVLPDGGYLIADAGSDRVRRVLPDGRIVTVAGNGRHRFAGDGGPAVAASLSCPEGLAVLRDGGFLIADSGNNRVRRVWPDGHISTVAGSGSVGFSGDGGPATTAKLRWPQAVAVLPDGGFLVADTFNNRVRCVFPDGRIRSIAGNGRRSGSPDFANGGDPTGAAITQPDSVAVLPDTSVLIGSVDSARMLVTGTRGTAPLSVAIRPLLSTASQGTYKVRLVLTARARLSVRLYEVGSPRPLLVRTTTGGAGESSLVLRRRGGFSAEAYAVDVRATAGPWTTRTGQFVYLGGFLTQSFVEGLQNTDVGMFVARSQTPTARIASPTESISDCAQFSPTRVDCEWSLEACDWVEASFLSNSGQIYDRTYSCPSRRRPKGMSGRRWLDLSGPWAS